MKRAQLVRYALTFAILAGVGYFFWRAFTENWATLRAQQVRPSYPFILLTFAVIPLGALASTWAWHTSLNVLARGSARIDFRHSFGMVNTSSMTKYVPGKIWAYALQMFWLGDRGFSKSLIVFVNLINLGISLVANMLLGLTCWLVSADSWLLVAGLSLAALLLVDLALIAFSERLLAWLVGLVNRLFKRSLGYFQVSPGLMLQLHAAHLLAAFASGLAALLLCFAIGYPVSLVDGVRVTSSSLVADVAGYLAFMVPGGIGVREGLMFAMLGGAASGPLALVLPLAMRVVSMLSDLGIGAVAFKLLPPGAKHPPS